jgi:hypothetical protein
MEIRGNEAKPGEKHSEEHDQSEADAGLQGRRALKRRSLVPICLSGLHLNANECEQSLNRQLYDEMPTGS